SLPYSEYDQPLLQLHRATLFPYTTLFRSAGRSRRSSRRPRKCSDVDRPCLFLRVREKHCDSHLRCSWRSPPPRSSSFPGTSSDRSEEHTSELQSRFDLVCRLLHVKKKEEV